MTVLKKKTLEKGGPEKGESLPFVIVDKVNSTPNLLSVRGSKHIATYST
jgi:hypothetical protein